MLTEISKNTSLGIDKSLLTQEIKHEDQKLDLRWIQNTTSRII